MNFDTRCRTVDGGCYAVRLLYPTQLDEGDILIC